MGFYMPNNFIDGIINRALETNRTRIVEQNRAPLTVNANSPQAGVPAAGVSMQPFSPNSVDGGPPGLMPRPGNQSSMPLGGIPNIAK